MVICTGTLPRSIHALISSSIICLHVTAYCTVPCWRPCHVHCGGRGWDQHQLPQCQWQAAQLCQPHFTSDCWYIFSRSQGRFGTFFSPKVLINSWRRMGKTPVSFLAPHQGSLGIIAWESFIWLNQMLLEDSNQSLTDILQWGRKRWWWQESPRTQPCSPFYRASIVYLLYIFLISAITLKHPSGGAIMGKYRESGDESSNAMVR